VEILEVAAGDEALLRSWHAAYERAQRHGRPYAVPYDLHEVRADLAGGWARQALRLFAGLVDGRVVTTASIELPLLDNTGTATVEVSTPAEHRRRGHGSAMLDHVVEVARDAGRTVLFAEVGFPLDTGPEGTGEPGPEFLRARGFALALGDVQRALDLAEVAPRLDALAAEAAPGHADYRIESFTGPVPEPLLASYVALDARVSTEAPVGELELEPQVGDPEAWRQHEATLAAQGRTMHSAVALDAAGEVVAYTLAVVTHGGEDCFQWGTLVAAEHRGHRLGLAVKVANLREIRRARPDARSVTTFNAESNAHMVAINERLGFRPVARLGEFQRRL
jgi:GNAT superfamily N-acetyltransferase